MRHLPGNHKTGQRVRTTKLTHAFECQRQCGFTRGRTECEQPRLSDRFEEANDRNTCDQHDGYQNHNQENHQGCIDAPDQFTQIRKDTDTILAYSSRQGSTDTDRCI